MKITAYNLMLSNTKKKRDLHNTLFQALETFNNTDFIPGNPENNKIIFAHSKGQIHTRSKVKPTNLPSAEEIIDIEIDKKITAKVTLSNYKQCAFSSAEIQNFVDKNGRLPKYSESHAYKTLNTNEFETYVIYLLTRAGLKDISLKQIRRHPLSSFLFEKRNISFPAYDVYFTASIQELDAFQNAWLNGIGRAKTYGFGMIQLLSEDAQ